MTERTSKREARERLRAVLARASARKPGTSVGGPHPEEARSAVSKDEAEESRASWFETPLARLLTMRSKGETGRGDASPFLPPSPTKLQQAAPDLTAIVRALYEDGVVPVVEIARLAGVAQRTLYRYVERAGWTRRSPQRGPAVAAANRGRPWRRPQGFAQPRGAGGRFLGTDEAGQPQPHGLKALDPAGAAFAAARSRRLAELAAIELASARERRLAYDNARTLLDIVRFARAVFDEHAKPRRRD